MGELLKNVVARGTTYGAVAMMGLVGAAAAALPGSQPAATAALCDTPPAGVPPLYWLIATLGMGVATLVCQTLLEIRRGKK